MGGNCTNLEEDEVVMNRVDGSEDGEKQLAVKEIREAEAARRDD